METILGIGTFFLENIFPLIVLLGLLIFVHELGHFWVALLCKVRVEIFSLGFGKKIFKYQRGATTYCLSLIPLGGYIKMYGDEPNAQVPDDSKHEAFQHKPVSQRIAVVLAGPLMNFFFAILILSLVAVVGEKMRAPILGDIRPDSAAAVQGFASGDHITALNSQPVNSWEDIQKIVQASAGQKIDFAVSRNGQSAVVAASVKLQDNPNVLDWNEEIGAIEGLDIFARTSHVGVDSRANSPARQAGVQPLDEVIAINEQPIKYWREIEFALQGQAAMAVMNIKLRRTSATNEESEVVVSVTAPAWQEGASRLAQLGLEQPDLYLSHIAPDSPAAKGGLQRGDRVLSISNTSVQSWDEVIKVVNTYQEESGPLPFTVVRAGQMVTAEMRPKKTSYLDHQGQEVSRFQVGIGPGIFSTHADPITFRATGVVAAFQRGWQQTIDLTGTIMVSFVRLLQNRVSPKNIGGIFTIGQVASETFKMGLAPYLKIMAVISINLFILNLLPIPILDGGHLVFFLIEAVRGSPLSLKKMELAQQIGLVLLMSLMVYALMNDISRLF